MEKIIINTPEAPAAIGPYVQGTMLGNLVFTSGQIPLDPVTMEIVAGGISVQSEQVMKNLLAVLQAAGSSTGKVLKTTCFLSNMGDFAEFNRIYAQYFGDNAPARSCIQAARLPKDVLVEVEAIAYR
ncbi:MAG: RidA family protein [Betaproteobacteria bacterium]